MDKKEVRELRNIKDNIEIDIDKISATYRNYLYAMEFLYEKGLRDEFYIWLGDKSFNDFHKESE